MFLYVKRMKNVDVRTAERNRQAEGNSQNHLNMSLVCRPFKGFLKRFHSIIGNFMARKTGLTGVAGGIFPSDFLDFHIPGKFSAVRILMSLAGFVPIVNCYLWDRAQSPALTCIPPKHLNITQRRGIQNKRGSCAVVISWFREGKVGKTEKQHWPHNEKEWMQKQI